MKPSKQPDPEEIQGPCIITPMHRRDQDIHDDNANLIIGKKGFRRLDRLQWLKDHGAIAQHQLDAGRRLQEDWQTSKLENYASNQFGGSGGRSSGDPSDAKLDAQRRYGRAVESLPMELRGLTVMFLCPEDHPFSLERCAAIVRIDRKAASFAIRTSLSILARHYGYAT